MPDYVKKYREDKWGDFEGMIGTVLIGGGALLGYGVGSLFGEGGYGVLCGSIAGFFTTNYIASKLGCD